MTPYEVGGFDPPAPVVSAAVRGPAGAVREVPLLMDTGADASVVPLAVANAVGAELRPLSDRIQAYGGGQVACQQADFVVAFDRFRFRGPFLVAETEIGVLGRNVLNVLVLTLDGPTLAWEMSGPRSG